MKWVVAVPSSLSQPAADKHDRKLQPFGLMHGHDLNLAFLGFDFMDVARFIGRDGLSAETVELGAHPFKIKIFPVGGLVQIGSDLVVIGFHAIPAGIYRFPENQSGVGHYRLKQFPPAAFMGQAVPKEKQLARRVGDRQVVVGVKVIGLESKERCE